MSHEDFDDEEVYEDFEERNTRTKELRLFTMCLKKFIKKIFQHMVATRFSTWAELAIHEQDGLVYPIYNYIIDSSDTKLRQAYAGYGLEIERGRLLLADLAVTAILEEENSLGLEFYLYETTSIVPYICDDYNAVKNDRPSMKHFRKINHDDFETLYEELKTNDIFDELYYELNKSILLIELYEREILAQIKIDSSRIISSVFARAKSMSNLSTITNTDIKELKLDFTTLGRDFSFVILNGHDADNHPVYSSVLTLPEYKSVAQYVDLDTLYDKLIKVLRAKNIPSPEETLLDVLKPYESGALQAANSFLENELMVTSS